MHLYPEAILCQWIELGAIRDMDFFWQLYELTDPVRRDGAVEEGRNNRNHVSKRAGKVTPLLQEQRHGSIGNVVRPQTEQAVSERRKLHRTPENRHYDIGFNRKQIIFQADVLEKTLPPTHLFTVIRCDAKRLDRIKVVERFYLKAHQITAHLAYFCAIFPLTADHKTGHQKQKRCA